MKPLFFFRTVFLVASLSMLLSCDDEKKDEAVDCVKLVNRFDKALREYSADPLNKAKCLELKAAANEMVKNKICQVPGVDYQQYVNMLTCQ